LAGFFWCSTELRIAQAPRPGFGIARKKGALYSRPGNDLTYRFPLIVETLARLRSRSCIIEGEAVGYDDNGVASSIAFATAAMTKAFLCTPST
jgi:hypothetical protein